MLAAIATTAAATMAKAGRMEPAPLIAFWPSNVALAALQRSPLQKQVSVARTPRTLVWLHGPALSPEPPQSNVGICENKVSEN